MEMRGGGRRRIEGKKEENSDRMRTEEGWKEGRRGEETQQDPNPGRKEGEDNSTN